MMSNAIKVDMFRLFLVVVFLAASAEAQAQLDIGGDVAISETVPASLREGVAAYAKGNYPAAFDQLAPLASMGNAVAQFYLGKMYMQGLGVPQDYKESLSWHRKAAAQGTAESQALLGFVYYYGLGVPQDYKEAEAWTRTAAENGYAEAQHNLGWMYGKGQGVPQDWVQAYKWFNIAVSRGEEGAEMKLKAAEVNMTPKQMEEAQGLSRDWLEKHK